MLRRRAMLLLLLLLLPASCDATYTYDIQGCVGTARHLYREGDTRQRRPPLSHTHTCATQLQRRALARVTTIGIFSVLL